MLLSFLATRVPIQSVQTLSDYALAEPLWADPEGPDTLKNHKNIGFLSNTGPDTLKITKLQSQHSMLGNHRPASNCHLNGVLLAGR